MVGDPTDLGGTTCDNDLGTGKAPSERRRFRQAFSGLVDGMRLARGADTGIFHPAKDDNAVDRTTGQIGSHEALGYSPEHLSRSISGEEDTDQSPQQLAGSTATCGQ